MLKGMSTTATETTVHPLDLSAEFRSPKGPQSVTILSGGPFGFAGPSIIAQATVLDGRRPSWADAPMIQPGDVLYLGTTWGSWKVVDFPMSGDWYRLVPQQGPRHYPTFEGHGSWVIRDREQDGTTVAHARSRQESIDRAAELNGSGA